MGKVLTKTEGVSIKNPQNTPAGLWSKIFIIITLVGIPIFSEKIAEGSFSKIESQTDAQGQFEIHKIDEEYRLIILEDFNVSEGPDLFFAFNPLTADEITSDNAKTDALQITPMITNFSGGKEIVLPSDFKLEMYESLIVHCWTYDHLWSTAEIKTPTVGINQSPTNVSKNLSPKIIFSKGKILVQNPQGEHSSYLGVKGNRIQK